MLAGHLLAFVELLGGPVLVPLGMTERGVVVEADLGIEGVHAAVGAQDQRVDLGEIAVAFGEAAVQLDQDVGRTVDRRRVREIGIDARLASLGRRETVDRVDVAHDDGVGIGGGDGLDLDATLGRQHQQVLLRAAVERERRVVLLGDVARALDPHSLDDVTLDVHAQDVGRVQSGLGGVVGQLDAAGLAAPADLHLGLDHDRVPGGIGLGDRLVDRRRDTARRHGDVVAGEVLLALILE